RALFSHGPEAELSDGSRWHAMTYEIIAIAMSDRQKAVRLSDIAPALDAALREKQRRAMMRFMMLMIPSGSETAQPGFMPPAKAVAAMMKYNEALKEAGVLVTLDGLHPPSMGARVSFAGGKPVVTDGPFTEAKEVLGGYWMIDVKSREEAIAWAKRCPASNNEIIEIRQV